MCRLHSHHEMLDVDGPTSVGVPSKYVAYADRHIFCKDFEGLWRYPLSIIDWQFFFRRSSICLLLDAVSQRWRRSKGQKGPMSMRTVGGLPGAA
jgi:hypothetical protein